MYPYLKPFLEKLNKVESEQRDKKLQTNRQTNGQTKMSFQTIFTPVLPKGRAKGRRSQPFFASSKNFEKSNNMKLGLPNQLHGVKTKELRSATMLFTKQTAVGP